MKEDKKKNRGSLTVETLLFLIPVMLAFCTIINMARFVQAEMIIHHAITQTATCQGHIGWIGWIYPGDVPKSGTKYEKKGGS